MDRPRRTVVLLVGPPGSGKTSIGEHLASDFGYVYEDREAGLLREWGSLEAFREHRDDAIRAMHDAFERELASTGAPLVYESTALTERGFVERLQRDAGAFTVLLTVTLDRALARIARREPGGNFSNAPDTTTAVWSACTETHASLHADTMLATDDRDARTLAAEINGALRRWLARSPGAQDQRG